MQNAIKYSKALASGTQFFSATGASTECRAPNIILVHPNMSETTRVRKLKLKSQLYMAKYSH